MTRHRLLRPLLLAATAVSLAVPLAATTVDAAPTDEAPADDSTPPEPAEPADPATQTPTGADPIDGGLPVGDPSTGLVERFTITPVGANDPNSQSNRPEFSYTLEPGGIQEDAVTVFNLGNTQLNFRVYGTDARNDDSGAFALIGADQEPSGAGSWVTMVQETVTVEPGMAATIPFTIVVPENATPGDHVGALVASSPTQGQTDDGTVLQIDRRTSTRLYIRVGGPIRAELAVENLSTSYSPAPSPLGGSATVSYRIQNIGNVRLGGTHSLSVSGPFGIGKETVDAVEFPELLPGQGIDVTTEVEGVPGLLLAFTSVTLEPTGGDSATAQTATGSNIVFAAPITLLLLLLVAVLGWYTRHRYLRRRDEARETIEFVAEPDAEPLISR